MLRFRFTTHVGMAEVGDTLLLAALAAESIHGRSEVRLDACFRLEPKSRICFIDDGTAVGRTIARVFTGYLIRCFGEEVFTVKRADAPGTEHTRPPDAQ